MTRDKINPRSCLSVIAVCCLLLFTPVFVYFWEHVGIFPHALSDQSKSSLWNAFKDTSSQQVKRMSSRDCTLVRFNWIGPEQTVWCEKEPNRLKIATMYNFLPLVRTKASELSDFPGVNTPLNKENTFVVLLFIIYTLLQEKCAQYWPTQEERELSFRDTRFVVTLVSEDVKSYYTTRVLELQNANVSFILWPLKITFLLTECHLMSSHADFNCNPLL